ncbi:hypothetical protein, partial [Microbispora bryophytorum]|uniref:hypothetical protein n=1 Tax=Microbispora bryophytorum TaxID=1460882 RepID=UPI0034921CF3
LPQPREPAPTHPLRHHPTKPRIPQPRLTSKSPVDLLPNLQLLAGVPNTEKHAKLPAEWLAQAFAIDAERQTYLHENDLQDLPLDLREFLAFIEQRKQRMRTRLNSLLGVD